MKSESRLSTKNAEAAAIGLRRKDRVALLFNIFNAQAKRFILNREVPRCFGG